MIKTLQIIVLSIFSISFGQKSDHLEKHEHIFWNENIKLESSDFHNDGKEVPNAIKYCDTTNLCTVGAFGIFAVLDIPKKKKKRGKLEEKLYIVPAFDVDKSYRVKDADTLGVEKQQVVFNIHELSARWMRRELKNLTDTMKGYGTLSIWFKTIENKALKMNQEMVDGYTYEVFIKPRPNAYLDWKKQIDSLLIETKGFKTSEKDIKRFTFGKPILEEYKMAKQLLGNMFN